MRRIHPALAPALLAAVLGFFVPIHGGEEAGDRAVREPAADTATETPVPPGDPAATTYGATPDALLPYRDSDRAHRSLYLKAPPYRGPSRAKPEPTGLTSVRVGLLAPLQEGPDADAGRSLKQGVEMALDEANAGGGYKGLPFEMVARNDQALWGSSGNTLVELAYEDRVWAIIGSIDSNSTHVALRAALKAEVMILNVGSSDPTMTETGIPWIVRCTPDARQTGYRLARHLFQEKELSRVAVLRSSDRLGRFGVREFRDAARRLRRPLPLEILFPPGATDLDRLLDRVTAAGVEAVVLWARAEDAARIVHRMRARGMSQLVAGTPRLLSPRFLEIAGDAAAGTVAPAWLDPGRQDPVWTAFQRRFESRFGKRPDAFAAYGFDAAMMLVDGVRTAGLNRARIRDALTAHREFSGVSGKLLFDETSNNISPLLLAHVEEGRFVYEPAAEESKPVRIGVLAADTPAAVSVVAGITAAAEQVNRDGGTDDGRLLELVQTATARPWRQGASRVARLVFESEVAALLGSVDGTAAHEAALVATRSRVPLVTLSPETSLTQAGAAWVFRGVPDDFQQARFLLQWAFASPVGKRAVLAVPAGREGRERRAALMQACGQLGVEVTQVLEPGAAAAPLPPGQDPDVLLLWLDPDPALAMLETLAANRGTVTNRAPATVLGSLRLSHPSFLEQAAPWLDNLPGRLALVTVPTRDGRDPWWTLGHDLLTAVASTAADGEWSHSRIRDSLASGQVFTGQAGSFSFDAAGNRAGALEIQLVADNR